LKKEGSRDLHGDVFFRQEKPSRRGGALSIGTKIQTKLLALFDREALKRRAHELGAVKRERVASATSLVLALITSALSGEEKRSISSARREFEALVGKPIEESAFRKRLNAGLLKLLLEILGGVMADTGRAHRFRDFEDIILGDSTTCMLPGGVTTERFFPSTVEGRGGIKVSTLVSLGRESLSQFRIAAARHHDRKLLQEHAVLHPGTLVLLDMGYADHGLMVQVDEAKSTFIIPLKSTTRLELVRARAGVPSSRSKEGTLLDGSIRYGEVVDADVRVSTSRGPRVFRAVMVRRTKRDGAQVECWYLTNLPPTFSPDAICDLYRLRWQVERFYAQGKGIARLDHITSSDPTILFIQIVSSLIAITLARSISADLAASDAGRVNSPDRILKVTARFLPRIADALLRRNGMLPRLIDDFVRVLDREGRHPNPGRPPAAHASAQRQAA
jgi:hypothetical protein